jgi:hypothetical protein
MNNMRLSAVDKKANRRKISEFASARTVAEVLRKHSKGGIDDVHDIAMVTGMLGACSKKNSTVNCPDEYRADAKRYCSILTGEKPGKITDKDAERIAQIIDTFISHR